MKLMSKNFLEKIAANETVTIDFIGDSITYGEIHCRREQTIVAQFCELLAKRFPKCQVNRYDGIPIAGSAFPMKCFEGPVEISHGEGGACIDVIRNGIGGSTVKKACERPQDYAGELANGKKHDIVFLMFGINDALTYDKGKYVTPEQFKQNYIELIEILKRADPSCTVVILSATTNKYTIEGHVEKTAEMVQELSLPYIDTHSLWLSHYDESAGHFGHGDWLYDDNDACHPTKAGSEKTAEFIFSEFIALCEAEKI